VSTTVLDYFIFFGIEARRCVCPLETGVLLKERKKSSALVQQSEKCLLFQFTLEVTQFCTNPETSVSGKILPSNHLTNSRVQIGWNHPTVHVKNHPSMKAEPGQNSMEMSFFF
jgi:hypothetical protein